MRSNYKAMVLSCIDPRFQPIVYDYLKKKKLSGKYSAFTIAGSAIGVTTKKKIIPIIIGDIIFPRNIPNLNQSLFKGVKILELNKPRTKKIIEIITDQILISWL